MQIQRSKRNTVVTITPAEVIALAWSLQEEGLGRSGYANAKKDLLRRMPSIRSLKIPTLEERAMTLRVEGLNGKILD